MTTASTMTVEGFFDPATCTISYLLFDSGSGECALIDSVLDYDPKSGRTRTASADQLIARVAALGARVRWLLETHVHADHLSAAPYLKTRVGGEIAIGRHVTRVQDVFGKLFNAGPAFAHDGSQFDRLLDDGDTLALGALSIRAMHTPGHTPACMTYVVTEAHAAHDARDAAAFVGDTLFMPDYGTARCDFPGGDARSLYRSIRKVLSLRPRRACTCATTISRTAVRSSTRAPSPTSCARTCTSAKASPRTISSRCAPRATRRSTCRC